MHRVRGVSSRMAWLQPRLTKVMSVTAPDLLKAVGLESSPGLVAQHGGRSPDKAGL